MISPSCTHISHMYMFTCTSWTWTLTIAHKSPYVSISNKVNNKPSHLKFKQKFILSKVLIKAPKVNVFSTSLHISSKHHIKHCLSQSTVLTFWTNNQCLNILMKVLRAFKWTRWQGWSQKLTWSSTNQSRSHTRVKQYTLFHDITHDLLNWAHWRQ